MHNTDSTIDENIRYFIYKYDLLYDDWFRDLNKINVKVDSHVYSITNYVLYCIVSNGVKQGGILSPMLLMFIWTS